MIEKMGGRKAFEEFTLERFQGSWAPQAFAAAVRFDHRRDNLYFWGNSGVGKTFLSIAIAHRALDAGKTVHASIMVEFKDALKRFENEHDYGGKHRFLESCINSDLLIFQEFGRGTISDMAQETLQNVLERRFLAGRNGLIVTSNYPVEQIAVRLGGTISRRIMDLCGPAGIIRFPDRLRNQAVNG